MAYEEVEHHKCPLQYLELPVVKFIQAISALTHVLEYFQAAIMINHSEASDIYTSLGSSNINFIGGTNPCDGKVYISTLR